MRNKNITASTPQGGTEAQLTNGKSVVGQNQVAGMTGDKTNFDAGKKIVIFCILVNIILLAVENKDSLIMVCKKVYKFYKKQKS